MDSQLNVLASHTKIWMETFKGNNLKHAEVENLCALEY